MRVLGIDTSCDDTGVGITDSGLVLANLVVSQTALHKRYGGVMPEAASREHLEVIDEVVEKALLHAQLSLSDIDIVAATYGPGLVGALLVGLSYAKALAWGMGVPFVAVHHLEAYRRRDRRCQRRAAVPGADRVRRPHGSLLRAGFRQRPRTRAQSR